MKINQTLEWCLNFKPNASNYFLFSVERFWLQTTIYNKREVCMTREILDSELYFPLLIAVKGDSCGVCLVLQSEKRLLLQRNYL
jgi:hypothetical protein